MSQNRTTTADRGAEPGGAKSETSEAMGRTGTGTGAALTEESTKPTQNVLSGDKDKSPPVASAMTADEATASPPGAFAPFRYYVNGRIRNAPGVTIRHAGEIWNVQELTIEGELRLANSTNDGFVLVPLDERYIPSLFAQILPATTE